MFRADVRVLQKGYDPWMNNVLSRCYCEGWRNRFRELGMDTEGISVFYDDRGYFKVFGTSDPEQQRIIEECEMRIYREKEHEFLTKYSVPVERWWESLERYSSIDGGIFSVEYGSQRFRIKNDVYESMKKDIRVYRLLDEFYVENGISGLDEVISSILEEELMMMGPEESEYCQYQEAECEVYF